LDGLNIVHFVVRSDKATATRGFHNPRNQKTWARSCDALLALRKKYQKSQMG
jgi:hypothetical protein